MTSECAVDKVNEYIGIYDRIRPDIESKLSEFRRIWESGTNEDILTELLFCILTPQSNAHKCWDIILLLKEKGLLLTATKDELSKMLENGARFKNKKAGYMVDARERFLEEGIKEALERHENAYCAREWLVENIKGLGYKEASHFLRNIGLGKDIAILDRHILRNLYECGVIGEMPNNVSPKKYCEVEYKMKEFSNIIGIPMEHLDLVMWYRDKKEIFK